MTDVSHPPSHLHGWLDSVNIGTPREITWRGRPMTTSIWKFPVTGRIAVRGVNVEGDDQADRRVHGGSQKAVYAYGGEDLDWWAEQLGRPVEPGMFGENLTVRGISVSDAIVGERWRVGTVMFEVVQPRIPCFKLGIRMGTQRFVRQFAKASRPGAYLRIVEEGELAAGDRVQIVHRPDHDISVATIADIYHKAPEKASRLLEVPEVNDFWREWALKRVR
jgi:MOSC domain-containing protein YiiM